MSRAHNVGCLPVVRSILSLLGVSLRNHGSCIEADSAVGDLASALCAPNDVDASRDVRSLFACYTSRFGIQMRK